MVVVRGGRACRWARRADRRVLQLATVPAEINISQGLRDLRGEEKLASKLERPAGHTLHVASRGRQLALCLSVWVRKDRCN